MGDARSNKAFVAEQLRYVMCSSLAFDRRVGGEDHLGEGALFRDARHQLRDTYRLRPQAVQRRQMPFEHKVTTAIAGLLDGIDIHRPLNHTKQGVVSAHIGALRTQVILGQGPAQTAMTHALHSLTQGQRQTRTTAAITLKQLQSHALCSLLTYARQGAQGIDQLANQGTKAHRERSDKTTRGGLYPRSGPASNASNPVHPGSLHH